MAAVHALVTLMLGWGLTSCCCLHAPRPTQLTPRPLVPLPSAVVIRPSSGLPAGLSNAPDIPEPPRGSVPAEVPSIAGAASGTEAAAADSIDLMMFLRDPWTLPRFPLQGDSAGLGGRRKIALHLIDSLRVLRAPLYAGLEPLLAARGVRILCRFWLVQSLLVRAPRTAVASLSALDDVRSVVPRSLEVSPLDLQDSVTTEGQGTLLGQMGFDAYRAAGLGEIDLALLDTGVRWTHSLFSDPGHLVSCVDCFHDCVPCETTTFPDAPLHTAHADDQKPYGHGTSSASILVADGTLSDESLRPELLGALRGRLHSYSIYDPPTSGGDKALLRVDVMERALQHVLEGAYPVVLIETQIREWEPGYEEVRRLADAMFDADAVVVAPIGNHHPSLGAPGDARGVIAVGGRYINVNPGPERGGQGFGRTRDHRKKPDVEAWTNTFAAIRGGAGTGPGDQPDRIDRYNGTSGAAPYVAAAAGMARQWLEQAGGPATSGNANAFLILSGRHDPRYVAEEGAGLVELPTDGWATWGTLPMERCRSVVLDLPFDGLKANRLEGALWWREPSGSTSTSDVLLELLSPSGATLARSALPGSFQRASALTTEGTMPGSFQRASAAATAGTWKLRITTGCIQGGVLPVHWAVALRR